jgi:hypothetical protein
LGWGQWWSYTNDVVAYDPDKLGVYELGDEAKNTVYYGSGMIKTRLLDHLNKKECPMARYYRFELFNTEAECKAREKELLEDYKQKHGKLPMYNEKIV